MFVDRTESYIVSNESLLGGEPVIRGTKTPVRAIVEMWRMGVPPDEIPMHLPHSAGAGLRCAALLRRTPAGDQSIHSDQPRA